MLLSSRPERMWTWDSSLVLQQHSALQIYLKTFIVYSNNLDSNISIEVSWDSTFHTKK